MQLVESSLLVTEVHDRQVEVSVKSKQQHINTISVPSNMKTHAVSLVMRVLAPA